MDTRPASASSAAPAPPTPDGHAPGGSGLPRWVRLKRSADFERVLARGGRVADAALVVRGARNGLGLTRLGLLVGRRHGNAVRRNRVKRVLREAFRLVRTELPVGLDLLVAPAAGAVPNLAEWRAALLRLAVRLARRLEA